MRRFLYYLKLPLFRLMVILVAFMMLMSCGYSGSGSSGGSCSGGGGSSGPSCALVDPR